MWWQFCHSVFWHMSSRRSTIYYKVFNPRVIVEKPLLYIPLGLLFGALFDLGEWLERIFLKMRLEMLLLSIMDCVIESCWQIFLAYIDDMDVSDMWFEQDGATCDTTTETLNLLQTKFPNRIISRNSAVNWTPRLCDLTPLDYFFWSYVKDQIYAIDAAITKKCNRQFSQVVN